VSLGCGEPNPLGRKAISGTITFDGSPLEYGMIEFSPTDPAGHSSGGVINDGTYQIPAPQGLPPGTYKARITSPTDSGPAEDEEEELLPPGPQEGGRQPPPAKERIPAEFNTKSDKLVDVTVEGPNTFDFEIPRRKKR